jgi:hypothetical protein
MLRGEQRGILKGTANAFLLLLHARFGTDLPDWVPGKLNSADEQTLDQWMVRILNVSTIDDVFLC